MRYYISDLHLFHKNMNFYMDKRGFTDEISMNNYIVQQWNSKVHHGDEVVVLGDFSIGKGKETNEVLRELHGRKYLIEGNHDKFLRDRDFNRGLFTWVRPYAEVNDNKRKVILCHYPIFAYNGQYRLDEQGNPKTYMLYGHVHDTMDQKLMKQFQQITRETYTIAARETEPRTIPCNMINCFCMYSDYIPLTLDEWIELTGT